MTEEQIVRTIVEKPNSYFFGSLRNEWKIYFNDVADLLKQLKELRENGFDVPITAGL
jgi:hypothetical protein